MKMVDVFVERLFDPPLTPEGVVAMAGASRCSFELHHVDWRESMLATDGRRMLCHFQAPDAESVRIAFRRAGLAVGRIWPGTLHLAAEPLEANVLVERRFDTPVQLAAIQALEDAGAWCLETHRVRFVRTFFSCDRTRMICLYRAPDVESVRRAQIQAQMPLERVWGFRRFSAEPTSA